MTGLVHIGAPYQGQEDLLRQTVPFVREGLAHNEPILVAQPRPQLEQMTKTFAGVPGITFVDMAEAGQNPGRILPWVLHAFTLRHPGRPVRIIGEPIWPGRSAVAYPACVQHEALINLALREVDATVLCPYDSLGLPAEMLSDAPRTHPLMLNGAPVAEPSVAFSWAGLRELIYQPLPAPPEQALGLDFHRHDLHSLRDLVTAEATHAGLTRTRIDALRLATTEAATNAIVHGGGGGQLRVWREGQVVIVDVRSPLPSPDPVAGRLLPPLIQTGGRGLILINHVCDLVRLYSDDHGTVLRLWVGPA